MTDTVEETIECVGELVDLAFECLNSHKGSVVVENMILKQFIQIMDTAEKSQILDPTRSYCDVAIRRGRHHRNRFMNMEILPEHRTQQ